MELFEIYTKGFLQAAGEAFTPLEKQTPPWGAKLMTMECGMRFLADYLEDVYKRQAIRPCVSGGMFSSRLAFAPTASR